MKICTSYPQQPLKALLLSEGAGFFLATSWGHAESASAKVAVFHASDLRQVRVLEQAVGHGKRFCACDDSESTVEFDLKSESAELLIKKTRLPCNDTLIDKVLFDYKREGSKARFALQFDPKLGVWAGIPRPEQYRASILLSLPVEQEDCGTGGGNPPGGGTDGDDDDRSPPLPAPEGPDCKKCSELLAKHEGYCPRWSPKDRPSDEDRRLATWCRNNSCCNDEPGSPPRDVPKPTCEQLGKEQVTCYDTVYCCKEMHCPEGCGTPDPRCQALKNFSCEEDGSGGNGNGSGRGGSGGGGGGGSL